MSFSRTRIQAADRVVEDVVLESVVDRDLAMRRRKWIFAIAAIVVFVAFVLFR